MGEEKKVKKKMSKNKKIVIAVAVVAVIGIAYACGSSGTQSEKKEVIDVTGQTAESAKKALEEAGFSDVTTTADKTGDSNMIIDDANWTVTAQEPKAGTKIAESDKITLTCKKTDEVEKDATDQAKSQFDSLVNGSLTDAMSKVSEAGYTATYNHAQSGLDFTGEFAAYTPEQLADWVVVGISNVDTDNKTVTMTVNTQGNIAENSNADALKEQLSGKLDPVYAWQAAEAYGETQYPYGFKLHYMMDNQAQDPADENTWFLKASCSVTNEYGAKADMTCEAKVTGTTNAPEVVEFYVY